MSDTLRDRIAAVLKAANDQVAGFIGYDEMADAVIEVIREENDEIRPALKEALASWGDEKLSLDQTFELQIERLRNILIDSTVAAYAKEKGLRWP